MTNPGTESPEMLRALARRAADALSRLADHVEGLDDRDHAVVMGAINVYWSAVVRRHEALRASAGPVEYITPPDGPRTHV